MIEIRNLSVSFGHGDQRIDAVRDISLKVDAGECFGLVGESGSGKSTILRALAGLHTNWQGEMSVAGNMLTSKRPREFCRQLQMIFQDPYGSLHPRHTINQILAEPLRIQKLGNISQRVEQILADVGLDNRFRYRFPHQLSGGQRQRVAIARAIILQPEVLLLDEPTSALDVSVQAEILNLLRQLQEEYAMTYIFVSHDLAVIAHMCERIAVMNRGRIVETITVEKLRRRDVKERYSKELLQASLGYDSGFAASLEAGEQLFDF